MSSDNRGTIRAALLRRAHPPETEALVDALRGLNRNRHGDVLCFCDMAIGNPMVTRHSAACDRARRALGAYEGDR